MGLLRLILLILLFIVSVFTVVKAPAYYIWLLAVLVGEYGLIFIGITFIILLSGCCVAKYGKVGTVTGVIALLLFLSPIVTAYNMGTHLQADMDQDFGSVDSLPNNHPFSIIKLFKKDPQASYKTIEYVTYPDTTLKLDFYRTSLKGKRPCVMVIHGGSWSSGDSRQLPELNGVLAKAGYQVASINYRLAPRWKSPAPVQDVETALNYLHQHADELHIDTSRFVLLGRSAGAQIALLAAYTIKKRGIKGVIDFYGPADMVWGYSIPAPKLVMDSRRVMANYLGGSYPKVPQNYAASSPIRYVNHQTVPTLIIHGEKDVLVAYEHSRRLSDTLQKHHVPYYWLQLPWATHGFDHHLNGPGGQLSTYAVRHFLQKVLK
ncbi:alpha/beta hydrolase fold domain-containing protein [Mucilaginibacter terrae]|uniref:alpha/beta hydrolase fold domain-containing protein n=1 Tax=Mucilaginibacter terrae TaxID=1955052 RepID=UPI00362F5E20